MYNTTVFLHNIQDLLKKGIKPSSISEESYWWHQIIGAPHTDFSAIRQLLQYSKNPDFLTPDSGESLLHLAIRAGKINIVGYLIAKGANPNIASQKPGLRCVEIMRGEQADRWYTRPGDTPLHIACRQSRSKIIALLLQKGAHPNIANSANKTPLEVLVVLRPYTEHLPYMQLLLEAGANAHTVKDYYEFFLQSHLQQHLQHNLQDTRQISPLLIAAGFYWPAFIATPLKEEVSHIHHQVICLLQEKLSLKEVYIGLLRALPRTLYFLKQLAGPYPYLLKNSTLEQRKQYQKELVDFNRRLNPILKKRCEYNSSHAYEKAIRNFLYIRHVEGEAKSSFLTSISTRSPERSIPHEIILQIKEHLIDQFFGELLSIPYQISQKEACLLFKACQKDFSFWHHFNNKRFEHDWHTSWPNHNDSLPTLARP